MAALEPRAGSDAIQPPDDAAARCEDTRGEGDTDTSLSEDVRDELDVLREIYGDDVDIRDRSITMTLRPRTEHQLVRVTALIELPPRYAIMITVLSFSILIRSRVGWDLAVHHVSCTCYIYASYVACCVTYVAL